MLTKEQITEAAVLFREKEGGGQMVSHSFICGAEWAAAQMYTENERLNIECAKLIEESNRMRNSLLTIERIVRDADDRAFPTLHTVALKAKSGLSK